MPFDSHRSCAHIASNSSFQLCFSLLSFSRSLWLPWYFLYFSYNPFSGCPSADACIDERVLGASSEHDVLEGVLMILLPSLMKIVHVELNDLPSTCLTKEV